MSKREEIDKLTEECINKGTTLTAQFMIDSAKDADVYPELNKYLWGASEEVLAGEGRLHRAHRLLISINITTGDGIKTRHMMHVRGTDGYQPYSSVVRNPDLAALKLQQLTEDIARARGRLRAFREVLPEEVATEIDMALETAEKRAAEAITSRVEVPVPAG